jgi:hypothetical protein
MSDDRQVEIDHLRALLKAAQAEVARLRERAKGVECITVGDAVIEVERREGDE